MVRLILIGVILWAFVPPVLGVERFVDGASGDDLNGANDCRDRQLPCKTIAQALEKAEGRDIIRVFSPGQCEPYSIDEPLILDKPLTIISEDPQTGRINPECTIIQIKIEKDEPEEAIILIEEGASGSLLRGFTLRPEDLEDPELRLEAGILVNGASSIRIEDNKIELGQGDGVGIWLKKSSLSRISNNTITGRKIKKEDEEGIPGNEQGIKLEVSSRNLLLKNRVEANGREGILLMESHDNRLFENIVGVGDFKVDTKEEDKEKRGNQGDGISLVSSHKNTLLNNKVNGNEGSGISLKPLKEELEGANENLLLNNEISGNGVGIVGDGIYILRSRQNMVSGNQAAHNVARGIFLEESEENSLIGNRTHNNVVGIWIYKGKSDRLIDNVSEMNKSIGLFLQGILDRITISRNQVSKNNRVGIYVSDEIHNSIISQNLIDANREGGVLLLKALDSSIIANTISGNGISRKGKDGLSLKGSNNMISENLIFQNAEAGIRISGRQNILDANTNNKNKYGIILKNAINITLTENILSRNEVGIKLENSSRNVISDNVMEGNKCKGIELMDSGDNQILRNLIIGNGHDTGCQDRLLEGAGLVLKGSSNNTFLGNTFRANFNGISIRETSSRNTFQCNEIAANSRNGIQVISADQARGNVFSNNNIEANLGFGIHNFMENARVNAISNWWGSPEGPSTSDQETSGDKILGPVDYIPWLRNPVDLRGCS